MTLETAFTEIHHFWPGGQPFEFGHGHAAARLSAQYAHPLPPDLVDYLDRVAPAQDVDFYTIGNPLTLYGLPRLGPHQDGYSWNPVTQQAITDWKPDFFLLGDEGADPVLLNLAQPEDGYQQLLHGAGNWETGDTLANTVGQLLLCAAARHYALTGFEEDPIIDDEHGFNLAPQAAAWLFPRLKVWAGDYYDAWAVGFDNA